jgi:hypothetical protein
MEMDYERYAVGEALLGWVNIQGVLEAAEKGGKNGGKKSKGAKALRSAGASPSTGRDANTWLMAVAGGIAKRLRKRGIEVAHLKLSLTHGQAVESGGDQGAVNRGQAAAGMLETGALGRTTSPRSGGMAAVQWVRSDIEPELTRKMERPWTGGRLLINLRAEGDPDVLAADTFAVLADQLEDMPEIVMTSIRTEHFRPGKPVPVHRVAVA